MRRQRWLYLTPVGLSLLVWVYGPLVATGVLSLVEWNLTGPVEFVGLANYRRLVEDPAFANSLVRTGWYMLGMLPFATVVPMGLAIMLWKRPGRTSDIYRALLFLPMVLAPVATAVSWQFVLNPLQGLLNSVLGGLGLGQLNWLGSADTALPVIVVITAGKVVALNVLLFGAALAAIDRSGLDAARIDGATEWEVTRYLVIPRLLRTTVLLALVCLVFAGQWVFTNVAVLTQGGPDGSTDSIYYRLYESGFTFFDIGGASAAAVVLVVTAIVLLGAASLVRRSRRARI